MTVIGNARRRPGGSSLSLFLSVPNGKAKPADAPSPTVIVRLPIRR
jgi:hypothetical protein